MILKSYAKLNLYLAILGKRKDSYHTLDTLYERIDLHDTMRLCARRDSSISLSTDSDRIPIDATNLAWRAARLMQRAAGVNRGVDIKIKKRIPVGSGMAGGSGNAATVLLGLNRLWNLALSRKRLVSLARKLGADVAFFVYEVRFARGLGRGDRVSPVRSLRNACLWHIIVVPNFAVSTARAYRKWDTLARKVRLTTPKTGVKLITSAIEKRAFHQLAQNLYNSLEEASIRLYPEIARIKQALAKTGVKTILMSGSGPAVYGIVSSRKEALSVRRRLGARNKAWQVFVAQTV